MKTISKYEVTVPVTFTFNTETAPINDWAELEAKAKEYFKAIFVDRLKQIGLETDEDNYDVYSISKVRTYLTPEQVKQTIEWEKRIKKELGW